MQPNETRIPRAILCVVALGFSKSFDERACRHSSHCADQRCCGARVGAEPECDMAGDPTRQIQAIRDRKLFRIAVGGSHHEDDAFPLGNGYRSEIHRCNGMLRDFPSNPGVGAVLRLLLASDPVQHAGEPIQKDDAAMQATHLAGSKAASAIGPRTPGRSWE